MQKSSPSIYFWTTAPFVGLIAVLAVIFPAHVNKAFTNAATFIYTVFDWYILWVPLAVFLICMYIALSHIGGKTLGGEGAKPEYSMFSWLSLLFTAGIGVGIIFYGPLEGLWHYLHGNWALLPGISSSQRAHYAMSTAIWLWGVPAWSIYTISGVAIAYFAYEKGSQFTTQAPIQIAFSNHKWSGIVAKSTMTFSIIAIGISLASSLAMASHQVSGGISYIIGSKESYAIYVLTFLFVFYITVALTPIQKGLKVLSDLTIALSIMLLIYIFLLGPTRYFLMTFFEAIGNTISGTFNQSFNFFIFDKDRNWINWYAMSYFIWWIGWTPFMGIFIAKVSKGRTYRQMIMASIFVPAGFIIMWFSVFSGFSILDTIEGSGTINAVANSNYEASIYALLELFPLSSITKPLIAFLLITFVVTTIVSGCITLGILTGKDGINPEKKKIFIWGCFMAAIAVPFVLSGKIEGIKAVGSLSGFPYVFVFFITIAALIKIIRHDERSAKLAASSEKGEQNE